MTQMFSKILCLHSESHDLKFLNPVRNRLSKLVGKNFCLRQFGDPDSQMTARIALQNADPCMVLILAHGGTDYIRGGEYVHRLTREIIEVPRFLSREEIGFLANKIVFCLSCDSNGLAHAALEAGAAAFVGFDAIPFNYYDDHGNPLGRHDFQMHAQQLIATTISMTLERFVNGHCTFDEAVSFLRLCIVNRALAFVRAGRVPERKDIVALLLRIKDGVCYYGPAGIRFAGSIKP